MNVRATATVAIYLSLDAQRGTLLPVSIITSARSEVAPINRFDWTVKYFMAPQPELERRPPAESIIFSHAYGTKTEIKMFNKIEILFFTENSPPGA